MNLTRFTDYALRTLIVAGLHRDRLVSIQEVSDAFAVSRNHLLKVAHALGKHGFLITVRGRGGGLRLSRPPEEIRVGDVARAMEPGFDLLECFDAARDRCAITLRCRLKGVLHRALRAFLDELDSATLADLIRERQQLLSLLGDGDRKSRSSRGQGKPGRKRGRRGRDSLTPSKRRRARG